MRHHLRKLHNDRTTVLQVGLLVIASLFLSVIFLQSNASAADIDPDCGDPVELCTGQEPYFVDVDGDIANGNNYGSGCVTAISDFGAWNNDDSHNERPHDSNATGYEGAGGQDALFTDDVGLDYVTDLNANNPLGATYNYADGVSPYYLSFANTDQPANALDATVFSPEFQSGLFGGLFGTVPCVPDYYSDASSTDPAPTVLSHATEPAAITGNVVNLSLLTGGTYSYTGNLIIDDTNPATNMNDPITYTSTGGKAITLVVNGNIYVRSDVEYAYTDGPTAIPQLNAYANGTHDIQDSGNVYIDAAVDTIHGNFVAEGNNFVDTHNYCHAENSDCTAQDYVDAYGGVGADGSTFSDASNPPLPFTFGIFADCANYNYTPGLQDPITTTANLDPCNKQLSIYGSVYANVMYLERSYGDLNALNGGTDASNAAEVFDYSPESWVPSVTFSQTCGGSDPSCVSSDYSTETVLPPVL